MSVVAGLIRFLEFAVVWGVVALALRHAILALREPAVRRGYAVMFASEGGPSLVEAAVAGWRRRLSRSLWINLVAIPIGLIAILVFAGEYGSGIHWN